jgi:hypothetical protein
MFESRRKSLANAAVAGSNSDLAQRSNTSSRRLAEFEDEDENESASRDTDLFSSQSVTEAEGKIAPDLCPVLIAIGPSA